MEKVKFNKRFIIGITLVSALGGLLFGYDWMVIGGVSSVGLSLYPIKNNGYRGIGMSAGERLTFVSA